MTEVPQPMTERSGVSLGKSIDDPGRDGPRVTLAVESSHDLPVAVRVRDGVPNDTSATDFDFTAGPDEGRWRAVEGAIEYECILEPGSRTEATYVPPATVSEADLRAIAPRIEVVQPVDPENVGEGQRAPLWRGGTGVAIEPPDDPDGVDGSVDDRRPPRLPDAGVTGSTAPTGKPAIGMDVTGECVGSVARTILRATRRGHRVFVSHRGDPDVEAAEISRQLGATVVELQPNEDPERRLAELAREEGAPGLTYHPESSRRVDSERSEPAPRHGLDSVVAARAETVDSTPGGGRVIVGIPAYNEEIGIGSVVLAAREYADEVIVVDDGSRDDTASIAERAGATVVRHETNEGKGSAIRTLLEHARGTDFSALVLLDGDGQHVPADIPRVVRPVLEDDVDLVIGSRYLDGTDNETPRYRRVGQRVLDWLTMRTSNTRVMDSQSGFRALSPAAVDRLSITADNFAVESEMINLAARRNLEIVEEAIAVRYRGIDGQTQHPLQHGLSIVTFVLQLVRDRHPLLFFGMPGLFITTIGVMYGIDGILLYQNTGQFYPAKALVSGFVTIIGVLGLFTGVILNRIKNIIEVEAGRRE